VLVLVVVLVVPPVVVVLVVVRMVVVVGVPFTPLTLRDHHVKGMRLRQLFVRKSGV